MLASDVCASVAYKGTFTQAPKEGGDCSHVDISNLDRVELLENTVYAGNVTMLHESLHTFEPYQRTLVRLNVPTWSPV